MPTVAERLRHVTSKVERAKQHVADLERQVRAFLDTNPYKVGAKHDPQTRKLIYYVSGVEPTPDCLALLAGDAIQNLMSALDHLAYQLVCHDSGDKPPHPERIYFPIRWSADEYETLKGRKIEGASADTLKAIDALKPYKGGNDLLWVLYRLNSIEKHRLLITVGSVLHSINLGAYMHPEIERMVQDMMRRVKIDHPEAEIPATIPVMDFFVRPADSLFPLEVGDELFIGAPDDEPNEKMQFRFNVAIREPEIIEAQSLVETLHQLTALVEGIVTALTPRLQ
jgi:hypothetical protein